MVGKISLQSTINVISLLLRSHQLVLSERFIIFQIAFAYAFFKSLTSLAYFIGFYEMIYSLASST